MSEGRRRSSPDAGGEVQAFPKDGLGGEGGMDNPSPDEAGAMDELEDVKRSVVGEIGRIDSEEEEGGSCGVVMV